MPKPKREERPGKDRPRSRAKLEGAEADALRASTEAFRKRRNRRYLFLAIVAASFPILETVAYQYRSIEVRIINDFRTPIKDLKVVYPGGEITEAEIKPDDFLSRRIRPNFSFDRNNFSTYRLDIRFSTDGGYFHQYSKAGTIDYSAHEIYTVVASPPAGRADLQHTTRPGFPLGLIRDTLKQIGIN